MFTQALFILTNSKESVSDIDEFSSIENIFLMLFGMLLGEYYLEEFDQSWLLLALKIFFMFLMTIIMLNILIAVVSDSYENAITRARKLYLRALFQMTANHVLLFENTIQKKYFDILSINDILNRIQPNDDKIYYYPTYKNPMVVLLQSIEDKEGFLWQGFFSMVAHFCVLILFCNFVVVCCTYGIILFFIYCSNTKFNLLNVSSMMEDENDNEWLGRVLDMERRLYKIVKSSQEVQIETSFSQIKDVRSQIENQSKEFKSQIENQNSQLSSQINELKSHNKLLESKLDLLLEAIKNPSS